MERTNLHQRVSYPAVAACVVFCGFLLCGALTAFVLTPLQHLLFTQTSVPEHLVYLPHGVCVLATMLYGWKMLPVLFAGNAANHYLFQPEHVAPFATSAPLAAALIATPCAFIAFELFRICGKNYYVTRDNNTHWRDIIGVGVIAALIAAGGTAVLASAMVPGISEITSLPYAALGKISGFLVLLFTIMLLFRWVRLGAAVPTR